MREEAVIQRGDTSQRGWLEGRGGNESRGGAGPTAGRRGKMEKRIRQIRNAVTN